MKKPKERQFFPAFVTLVCLVVAYLWVGWRGPVIGLFTGTVMGIGAIYNQQEFLRQMVDRQSDVSYHKR